MQRFSLQTLFAVVTISAVFLGGLCLARNNGGLLKTGKPLDIAIVGDGYFQIELENVDRTLYTRNGHFHLDLNGALAAGTAAERRMLFPNVTLPPSTIPVIAPDGGVMCYWTGKPEEMAVIGSIQLVTFPNPLGLKQVADDLYEATDESGSPMANQPGSNGIGLLRSGCLEHPESEHWFADLRPSHVLMLGIALVASFLLMRELRAQRRELTKLQMLLGADYQIPKCAGAQ